MGGLPSIKEATGTCRGPGPGPRRATGLRHILAVPGPESASLRIANSTRQFVGTVDKFCAREPCTESRDSVFDDDLVDFSGANQPDLRNVTRR